MLSTGLFAIEDRNTASFQSGVSMNTPLATGQQVTVEDVQNQYMTLNNPGYQSVFKNKSNQVIVKLRYDDSRKFNIGYAWYLNVYYHTEFTDLLGNVTVAAPSSSMLKISYLSHTAAANYTDIAVNTHSLTNCYKVKIVVDDIRFNSATSNPIPATLEDIFLDVTESTERYYVFNGTAPAMTTQFGFNNTVMTGDANSRLPLAWSTVAGAESYDLEWLFIQVSPPGYFSAGYPFDFRNAVRINLKDNHYEIPLAFPKGTILYRVRGIGYDYNGSTLTRIEGAWSSAFPDVSSTSDFATTVSAATRYDYNGLDNTMNWVYRGSFAEEGKRKESIVYSDGGLKERQVIATSASDNNVIVSAPVYDFEGRPAITVMPAPITSTGLHYYSAMDPDYHPVNFDTDAKATNPDAYNSSTAGAGYIFSQNNPGNGGIYDQYVPTANDYPYARTRYTNDGSGRVRGQTLYGDAHKVGSNHDVRYIYGKPASQEEMDRLFGNEVGSYTNYNKIGRYDENGQLTINYVDNHNRIVASCLAGDAPANLKTIDNKPVAEPLDVNLLSNGNNVLNSNGTLSSSQSLMVTAPGVYKFMYSLSQDTVCLGCAAHFDCPTCLYDLRIQITNENGGLVSGTNYTVYPSGIPPVSSPNPIIFEAAPSITISFDVNLAPGTYAVDKILSVNQGASATLAQNYINDQLLAPTCIQYPLISPDLCANSCQLACQEAYTRYNFDTQQTYYVDDDEHVITQTQAQMLINECTSKCNEVKIGEIMSQCTMNLKALMNDMKPGGQYFSNTMVRFINDPTLGLIDNPNYAAHEYDWLNANITGTQPSDIFTALSTIAGITISSWADVEAHWKDAFSDVLVKYHPEYCAYQYFCEGSINCGRAGNSSAPISISDANAFDYTLMYADDAGATAARYFNMFSIAANTTHNASTDFVNGNTAYCSSPAAVAPNIDPFLRFDCDVSLPKCNISTGNYMLNYMKKYLSIGSGKYFSIWYVMDDPDNIHLLTTAGAGTPPQATIDLFKALHGDGTPSNPGLFASSSKWNFFNGAYQFYKQLFIYQNYQAFKCLPPSTMHPLATPPSSVSLTHSDPTIHYPANSMYDQIIATSPNGICDITDPSILASVINSFSVSVESQLDSLCSNNCRQAAASWMAQLENCSINPSALPDVEHYLIEVCKKECNIDHSYGTSGCDPADPTCQAVTGPGGALFYNFDDVIHYYSAGTCSVTIRHPQVSSEIGCSCATLDNFISENNLNPNNPAAIATALNSRFYNTTSYTASDITHWKDICNAASSTAADLLSASYPEDFVCNYTVKSYSVVSCSCEKLSGFINQIGYDPTNPAHRFYIVAAINNYFALPPAQQISLAQLNTILSACQDNTPPTFADFAINHVPSVLLCPEPVDDSPEALEDAQEMADCQQTALTGATGAAVLQFNAMVNAVKQNYINAYISNCIDRAKQANEQFSMKYSLNEYLYTLYYYDQAGNLIKTVPPQGIVMVPTAQLVNVQNYRKGTSSTPVYPAHRMLSKNTYDSENNVLTYATPDADPVKYWYDERGRIALSQDGRQAATTPIPAYSHTTYDEYNRVKEVKQIYLTGAITYEQGIVPGYLAGLGSTTSADQITKIYYDTPLALTQSPFASGQQNVANRISSITYQEGYSDPYAIATHYSYDVHGLVNTVAHENNYKDLTTPTPVVLFATDNRYQTTAYEYEVGTGNVTKASYQVGKAEALYEKFNYDANSRLSSVYSSNDNMIWENDARYFYYAHGPLARTELGDKQIQGIDFAYTINGWLKGVNSSVLNKQLDMGKDGREDVNNPNENFATDANSYTNGYFRNDYKARSASMMLTANSFEANPFATSNVFGNHVYLANTNDLGLYNGNLSSAIQHSRLPNGTNMEVYGKTYDYDQLYRLKAHESFRDASVATTNSWTATGSTNTVETFTFDFNGNMNALKRTVNGVTMDNVTFNYPLALGQKINNRLLYQTDAVASTAFQDDMDTQSLANNTYDENGRIIKDNSVSEVSTIEYNLAGKIRRITHATSAYRQWGSSYTYPSDLEYYYDAYGRRSVKIVKPRVQGSSQTVNVLTANTEWIYTMYGYDGHGNVVAVYTWAKRPSGSFTRQVEERYVHGHGRVSQANQKITLGTAVSANHFERTLGNKVIELGDASGDVRVTVLDYKVAGNAGTHVTSYNASVMSAMDHFAYGAPVNGRIFITQDYRYGQNGGSEKDLEVNGQQNMYSTFYRELDTRQGRWWQTDPIRHADESPYVANNNNPINVTDPLGDKGDGALKKAIRNFINSDDFQFKRNENGGGFSMSYKHRLGWFTPSINLTYRKYSEGLGTTEGETKRDLVITPAVAFGGGTTDRPLEQSLFNSYSESTVDNDYDYSLVYGVNFVMNQHRSQAVGAFMLKVFSVHLTTYNDVNMYLLFLHPGNDRWWTGGGNIGWDSRRWGMIGIGTEVFTGQRIVKNPNAEDAIDKYETYTKDGEIYYKQTSEDKDLTNGMTYIRAKGKTHAFYGSTGPWSAMWSQNVIHKHLFTPVLPMFESEAEFKHVQE